MRLSASIIVLTIVVSLVCLAVAEANEVPTQNAKLLQSVGSLQITDKSMLQIAFRMAAIADIPVAVETLDGFNPFGNTPDTNAKLISISTAPDTTVASVLDSAIAQDPRYEWVFDGKWLHVIPRKRPANYPLDAKFQGEIPSGKFIDSQLKPITERYLPKNWAIGISIAYNTKLKAQPDIAPVSSDLTVRQAIDAALWRIGISRWSVTYRTDKDGNIAGATLTTLL